jgi:transglutaminase-like putative cysteine protease
MPRIVRTLTLAATILTLGWVSGLGAGRADARDGPVLHEPIAPDPSEDLALRVAVDGDLPAAIQTPNGVVGVPDPLRPPTPFEPAYGPAGAHDAFVPDTDTKRPELSDYDDPFTPSTAPFKRLEAFDSVRSDYQLEVRDERLVRLTTTQSGAPPAAGEDPFYGDLVVDVPGEGSTRIPSVGPGARVVRARLGVGASDVPFRILRDGADNWFLQLAKLPGAPIPPATRARLVMEVAIPRAAFGGPLADANWSDLPIVTPLPDNVARDAFEVRSVVGVSRAMRPREAIAKLVDYFRGFVDSVDPPRARGSVYLDLALSRKGVCRHRAFAFLVTAQSLGIPTRLVENEAHAWVEVHDGRLWRRIDLGGAGRLAVLASSRLGTRDAYEAPHEVFPWPPSAGPGGEMISRASAGKAAGLASAVASGPWGPGATTSATHSSSGSGDAPEETDPRPPSTVALTVVDTAAHRGLPVHVRGTVRADNEPCQHVAVEISLRESRGGKKFPIGTLATNEDGIFAGVVIPAGMPLGEYDLAAETSGDARCGRGRN